MMIRVRNMGELHDSAVSCTLHRQERQKGRRSHLPFRV